MLTTPQLQILTDAHDDYTRQVSPHYDEVLHEVAARIAHAGAIGKTDIGALLFWKRLTASTRWVSELMNMPDADVRATTRGVVEAVCDMSRPVPVAARDARSALGKLPGFRGGDALASAALLAAAPERMAVYDRRAQAALDALGVKLTPAPGRYGRYMALVEDIRAEVQTALGVDWLARDVDTALFWLGG